MVGRRVDALGIEACTNVTSARGGLVQIDTVSGRRAGNLDYIRKTIVDAEPWIVDVDPTDVHPNDQIPVVVIQDPSQCAE
jgi:hypothetical protein